MNKYSHSFKTRQRGATLIVSLFMLLIMTILGVASMQNTTLEEKMSGNMRNNNVAFQASESGLRDAENWLTTQVKEPIVFGSCPDNTTCDVWALNTNSNLANQNNDWWEDNGRAYTSGDIKEAKTNPRHIIEYTSFVDDSLTRGLSVPTGKNIYRATASGTGGSGNEQAIVQSTLSKRFN